MTSPTVPAPAGAKPTNANDPPPEVVIGGTRLPLPRWARFVIGLLATIGAAVPLVVSYTASSKQPPKEIVQEKPVEKPPTVADKISEAFMIEFEESQKHADEEARTDKTILSSPDLGTLRVKFFVSDRCLQIIRKSPGANPQTSSHYIRAAMMEDRSPGKIAQMLLPRDSLVDQDWVESQMEPASLKPESKSSLAAPTGNCWNPHGGPFRWWNGEQRGCWLQVWRSWDDGCQHYQWFNTCNGYWDSLPNGAPLVYWTSCVH